MKKLPIDNALNNKNSLVKWLFNIHNLTNEHLNKKKYLHIKNLFLNIEQYFKKKIPLTVTINIFVILSYLLLLLLLL